MDKHSRHARGCPYTGAHINNYVHNKDEGTAFGIYCITHALDIICEGGNRQQDLNILQLHLYLWHSKQKETNAASVSIRKK